jgi:general secretion pathway protein G
MKRPTVQGFVSTTVILFACISLLVCAGGPGWPVKRARESTLKTDLTVLRLAIQNYARDRDRMPKALPDLVGAHYIQEVPTDPMTGRKDWVAEFAETGVDPSGMMKGIVNVHSASSQLGSNGMPYDKW